MNSNYKLIADSFGSDKVKLDEPLAEHMSTGIGGPAKIFFVALYPTEIIRMVKMARDLKVPFLIYGTGSKMLISDVGFDGVAVKNRTSKITVVGVKGKVGRAGISGASLRVGVEEVMVEVESGVSMTKLVEFLKKQGLDSDTISNIPGTVGGNLALSRPLLDLVQKIKVLDDDDDIIEIEKSVLSLRRHIILSAVFKFKTEK